MHTGRHKHIYIRPYHLLGDWELMLSYLGGENEVSTASDTEILSKKPDTFRRGDSLKLLAPNLSVLGSPPPVSLGSKRLGLQ